MKKQQGFTLVETVIALAVTSMLIFVIINFMTNSIVEYSRAGARANLLGEAQVALDIIGNDIRLSGSADDNNRWPDEHAPSAPADKFSWQSDQDTLLLATAAEDSSGSIIFADPLLYISEKNNSIFYLNNGSLYKRVLAAPVDGNSSKTSCPLAQSTLSCPTDKKLLSDVQEFSAKYYNDQNQEVDPVDARSIELYVKLQKTVYGVPISTEYTTRMVFRNA